MTKHPLWISIFLAVPLAAATAGVYKWTDADGNVHFGDRPPQDAGSQELDIRPNTYSSPEVFTYDAPPSGDAAVTAAVTIFTTQRCGYCKAAKRHFRQQGIAYTEYDIERSAEARQRYQRLGATGVPVILVGNQRLNGFSKEAFDRIYQAAISG